MTTCIYDVQERILAADSRLTNQIWGITSYIDGVVTKIFDHENIIVAMAGENKACEALVDWVRQNDHSVPIPLVGNSDNNIEEFEFIIVFKDDYSLAYFNSTDGYQQRRPPKEAERFIMIGSGGRYLQDVDLQKTTACEAIQIASTKDYATGGDIFFKNLVDGTEELPKYIPMRVVSAIFKVYRGQLNVAENRIEEKQAPSYQEEDIDQIVVIAQTELNVKDEEVNILKDLLKNLLAKNV